MQNIQEYKCPCCGGAVEFNTLVQKMRCPYCDAEFEMETLKYYDEELQENQADRMEWEFSAGGNWTAGEVDGIRTYICKSCGGEIVGDENTAATSCPFCGNPIVLMRQFKGSLKPDLVIPFQLDKEAAKNGFQKHLSGRCLIPKVFRERNHIEEIKGMYVPFWVFSTTADAKIRYQTTKVKSWNDDNYKYKETKHYLVYRAGTLGFMHVPVDGSEKMPNDLMESIEPFDFSDAVDFQTAYLAGYFAEKYDVTAVQAKSRANQRIRQSTEDVFKSTVMGYSSVVTEESHIQLKGGRVQYVLYPVWILNTIWNGNKYTFAMNGQTGKFVGDLPLDKAAVKKWLFGLTAVFTVICYGMMCWLRL